MIEQDDEPRAASERLEWLTASQAAAYLQVSTKTFNRIVPRLRIPFVRPAGPNGDRRFFRADLDAALLSRRENLPQS